MIYHWGAAWRQQHSFGGFDLLQLRVVVVAVAAAQDTAGGAVMTAAGGAAGTLSETAVQSEIITGGLRGDSSNILEIRLAADASSASWWWRQQQHRTLQVVQW